MKQLLNRFDKRGPQQGIALFTQNEGMSSSVDIDVAPGQGNVIKGVHRAKHQTFERKKSSAARDRKEQGKKKEKGAQKFVVTDKKRARDDGTKGGSQSEERHSDSGSKGKKKKGSQVRGGLVDVTV